MKHSYIIGENSATLIDMVTGSNVTLMKSDKDYNRFLGLLREDKYTEAMAVADVATKISAFVGTSTSGGIAIEVKNNAVTYTFNGQGPYPLHNAIVDRIIRMADDGFNVKPLMQFLANLLNNPDKTSIDELYLFLEASALPITEDGCFIAYKIVRNDYMDIYSGTTKNMIGDIPSMPRFEVDPNRNNTCSRGLHFCSKTYLPHYGTQRAGGDRCMLVKINPADVVSIPSDYNNAKGRAWKYEVVGEMNATEWRKLLADADFTAASVVTPMGATKLTASVARTLDEVFNDYFYVDGGDIRWTDSGKVAVEEFVVNRLVNRCGVSPTEAAEYVFNQLRDDTTFSGDEDDIFSEVMDDMDVLDAWSSSQEDPSETKMAQEWEKVRAYAFEYNFDTEQWMDNYGMSSEPTTVFKVSAVTGISTDDLKAMVE